MFLNLIYLRIHQKKEVKKNNKFLGRDLNIDEMIKVVNKALYRNQLANKS